MRVSVPVLRDCRMTRPEAAGLDLNPVIARPDGAHVVDVRIKVATAAPRDPFLSQLR
jgi:hypothetical protein